MRLLLLWGETTIPTFADVHWPLGRTLRIWALSGCTLIPIAAAPAAAQAWSMVQLAIRYHPRAPISPELEGWLEPPTPHTNGQAA